MSRKQTNLLILGGLGLLLVVLAITWAVSRDSTATSPPATSSSPAGSVYDGGEQTFLSALDSHGIYTSSDQAALDLGETTCTGFDMGMAWWDIAAPIAQYYEAYESGYIVGAAVVNLCPEHTSKLPSGGY